MKTIISNVIIILILCFTACQSDDVNDGFESSAVITGPNYGACICCSGWFIDIENLSEIKWFESLPEGSNIDLNTLIFPASVWINWTAREEGCTSIIDIDEIILVE